MIRLRSLGDCVLTTPALSLLKQARPDLKVAIVSEDRFAPVSCRQSGRQRDSRSQRPRDRPLASRTYAQLSRGATSVALCWPRAPDWRAGFDHFRFRFCTTSAYRGRRKSFKWIGKFTPPNTLLPRCFSWACRDRHPAGASVCQPIHRAKPYAVLHPIASAAIRPGPRLTS